MFPSHNPPLHIAPLPPADSSAVSLLDDYDSSKPRTRVSYSGRRRISIAVIIPGILIFIACAGLASSLLVWLQSRRVESHMSREDPYFLNAIVAIEGIRAFRRPNDVSSESYTTMYGLAMSAVSVSPISPLFHSDDNKPPVGAAGISHCAISSRFARLSAGLNVDFLRKKPNAQNLCQLQPSMAYSSKLCGSANIFSAYETMQYLKRGRERRSKAPTSLIFCFDHPRSSHCSESPSLVRSSEQMKQSDTDNCIVPQIYGCTLPQAPSSTLP